MNAKSNPLLVGLLLLLLAVPCAFADDKKDAPCVPKPLPPPTSDHSMSPEARLLPEAPDPSLFKADPCNLDPYNSAAELEIYSGKHMIDRPRPPVELGLRLYDRGAYTPRPTYL